MLFSNISILDENFNLVRERYVAIDGDKIAYIGEERPKEVYGKEVDGRGKLLMPGFFNCHGHSPMTLMRGYGENLSLGDWLNTRIFPFEEKLDGNAIYQGTLLAMAESLANGIISTADMYYFLPDMARAVLDCGAKNNLARGLVCFGDDDFHSMESVDELKFAVKELDGLGDGRIKVDASLHGEYTSNPKFAKSLSEYVRQHNLGMHLHSSESLEETKGCIERHGKTPTKYLADLGLFDNRAIAAHCVHLSEEDMDILAEKRVFVATNPSSNLKLASGICPVGELLKRGANLTIGTDSVASNNALDMFFEMKLMAIVSKVKADDPTVVTPEEALYAATRGGALAQGRQDSGLIKEGFKADLILLDMNSPNMAPIHNLATNLVYSGSSRQIEMTMVDGKVLYEKGEFKTIDIEKTIFEVEKATKGILKSLSKRA